MRRVVVMTAVVVGTVVGCARQAGVKADGGATALPAARSSSQVESEVAEARLTLPGTPQSLWNTVIGALTDSSFRSSGGDYNGGVSTFRSLREGRYIRIVMTRTGADSTLLVLTGRRYVGRSGQPGVILAAREAWPDVLAGEPAASILETAAARIRASFAAPAPWAAPSAAPGPASGRAGATPAPAAAPAPTIVPDLSMSPDSLLRDLPGGRKGFCRANNVRTDRLAIVDKANLADWCRLSASQAARYAYNTYVLQDPAATPVGQTLEVCAISGVPRGFELLVWFTDPKRCVEDPYWQWKGEPNMMRLRRVQ